MGSDLTHSRASRSLAFQSTLPVWGATSRATVCGSIRRDFNPRSPCGERRLPVRSSRQAHVDFNPRSPCGERRTCDSIYARLYRFQSTLPVWGATKVCCPIHPRSRFQSTLPVWGATTVGVARDEGAQFQSTLPVWGATCLSGCMDTMFGFQSTLPVWGATRVRVVGRDGARHFNPRSPCGERQSTNTNTLPPNNFNPRSPCGERQGMTLTLSRQSYFNPRSPCGERPQQVGSMVNLLPIYCDCHPEFAIAIYN